MDLLSLYTGILDGTLNAIDTSEAAHLKGQLQAIKGLLGKTPTVDDIAKLIEQGWLPDYYIGASVQITAQLKMDVKQERKIDVNGGITLGPVQITAGFSQTDSSDTQTNLSVNTVLNRQSRSKGLDNALASLMLPGAPSLPPAASSA